MVASYIVRRDLSLLPTPDDMATSLVLEDAETDEDNSPRVKGKAVINIDAYEEEEIRSVSEIEVQSDSNHNENEDEDVEGDEEDDEVVEVHECLNEEGTASEETHSGEHTRVINLVDPLEDTKDQMGDDHEDHDGHDDDEDHEDHDVGEDNEDNEDDVDEEEGDVSNSVISVTSSVAESTVEEVTPSKLRRSARASTRRYRQSNKNTNS